MILGNRLEVLYANTQVGLACLQILTSLQRKREQLFLNIV